MRLWPALDVLAGAPDLALAALDDFSPTAIEERDETLRAFFADTRARDAAAVSLAARFSVSPIDVSDEDWARRSQQNLTPITVGRITIRPNSESPIANPKSQIPDPANPKSRIPSPPNPESQIPNPVAITIVPSTGFGTGHHATTRLCLAALQTIDLNDTFVLDVGTGSGVLAIAAVALGAERALGIDTDPDAIQSASENLRLNPVVNAARVSFEVADLTSGNLPRADVVTANLTGALLVRTAPVLTDAVREGGSLILSGILIDERDEVVRAFSALPVASERHEDGWLGLIMKKS